MTARDARRANSPVQQESDRARPAAARGLRASVMALQTTVGNRAVQRHLADRLGRRAAGRPLTPPVRERLEQGLGADLGSVRVHADAEADGLARAVDADAFTTGRDIFFRAGAFDVESPAGARLLAHEAAHVVQQARGEVAAPAPGEVAVSRPGDALERAADKDAATVEAGGDVSRSRVRAREPSPDRGLVIQRGRLTTNIENIRSTWTVFKERAKEVDSHLLKNFLPALEKYKVKQPAWLWGTVNTGPRTKAKHPGLAHKPAGEPGLPDKDQILLVAAGLANWTLQATEGADRYYAEMRSALTEAQLQHLDVLFGTDTDTEPDVTVFSPAGVVSLESKSIVTDDVGQTDRHIRIARGQATKRVAHATAGAYTGWIVPIEIKSRGNTWPFTKTDGLSGWDLPVATAHVEARAKARNLAPAAKSGPAPALPLAQAGKHRLDVRWLDPKTSKVIREIQVFPI